MRNGVQERRKKTKLGRYVSDVSFEEIQSALHLPSEQACIKLGIGSTMLKRVCRKFGIERWPYCRPRNGNKKHKEHHSLSSSPPGSPAIAPNSPGGPPPAPASPVSPLENIIMSVSEAANSGPSAGNAHALDWLHPDDIRQLEDILLPSAASSGVGAAANMVNSLDEDLLLPILSTPEEAVLGLAGPNAALPTPPTTAPTLKRRWALSDVLPEMQAPPELGPAAVAALMPSWGSTLAKAAAAVNDNMFMQAAMWQEAAHDLDMACYTPKTFFAGGILPSTFTLT